MNVGSLFTHHAQYRRDHLAVVFEGQRLTYCEYNQQINRTANALLDLGIQKGDKVATLLPNCLELLEVFWAVAKIGAIVVPMSTLLLESALVSLLNDSDTVAVIVDKSFTDIIKSIKDRLPNIPENRYLTIAVDIIPGFQNYHALQSDANDSEPPAEMVQADDVFNIMYSSGTTGLPKGIVHTHQIRLAYGTSFAASFRINPESVVMHAGAIIFNGAFIDLMPTVFQGATYILLPQFDPTGYMDTIAREKVTHVIVVPAQVIAMLNAPGFDPEKLASLEMIQVLGAPLHMEHKEQLNKVLPDRFYELYGLTEGFMTVLDKLDYHKKPQSVGTPPPLHEMKIVDHRGNELPVGEVGEICGKGPMLMPHYYKQPELTKQAIVDGWLHSGDIGYVDEDGFLYLMDRKKDMIISGGVNVYPRDIEEITVQHPAVVEAAVFGIPDERWGESPIAAVILAEKGAVSEEALKKWINSRVGAKFQRVAAVKVMKEFPRNVAGKTLKREMRELFS
ncbi:MAG: AMP-binding protein [Deltaproteobacteria bacterium]|nr:AMP-binding protein [Deltaproteobacteria bacterium]